MKNQRIFSTFVTSVLGAAVIVVGSLLIKELAWPNTQMTMASSAVWGAIVGSSWSVITAWVWAD